MKPDIFMQMVHKEADQALKTYGPFKTGHEAWGVLWEELDEFWEEVRKKKQHRSGTAMLGELVQIAATAEKLARSITGAPTPESVMGTNEVLQSVVRSSPPLTAHSAYTMLRLHADYLLDEIDRQCIKDMLTRARAILTASRLTAIELGLVREHVEAS